MLVSLTSTLDPQTTLHLKAMLALTVAAVVSMAALTGRSEAM
jgi:hypothetical protein